MGEVGKVELGEVEVGKVEMGVRGEVEGAAKAAKTAAKWAGSLLLLVFLFSFSFRGGTESGLGLEDSKTRPLFEDSDSTRTRKSRLEGTRESKILDLSKKSFKKSNILKH